MHQDRTTQTSHSRVSSGALRYNSPDYPVSQRATALQRQRSSLTCEQCTPEVRAEVRSAPDCPVPHEDKASNGRSAPSPNDRVTWRRTGHCPVCTRLSGVPVDGKSLLSVQQLYGGMGPINTTPTCHFKVWEPKQHIKAYSIHIQALPTTSIH